MLNTAAKQSTGKDANVFMLIAKGGTERWRRRKDLGREVCCEEEQRGKREKGKMEMIKR